jgi:hypothetical protein
LASKDGEQYDLFVAVPEDMTDEELQSALREAKTKLYTPQTHEDEFDADDIGGALEQICPDIIFLGSGYRVDTGTDCCWDMWD